MWGSGGTFVDYQLVIVAVLVYCQCLYISLLLLRYLMNPYFASSRPLASRSWDHSAYVFDIELKMECFRRRKLDLCPPTFKITIYSCACMRGCEQSCWTNE